MNDANKCEWCARVGVQQCWKHMRQEIALPKMHDMMKAYMDATEGTEDVDAVIFYSYENYVRICEAWGLKPLPEKELLELVNESRNPQA